MALTKTPIELSSTPGIVDNSNATAITIDSSENVTLTGEIIANGGIALPDSQKATFGAGDDLKIHHNGSNSFIQDSGTGDLIIAGTNLSLRNYATDEIFLDGTSNAAVRVFYNGAAKLATTNTGIDVTGTASATSVTAAQHLTAGSAYSVLFGDGGERISGNNSSSLLSFFTGATERMRIDSSGDVVVGGTSSGANDAVSLSSSGYIQAIVNGDTVGYFNRRTNDGEILRFQKDGTTVGSIGVTVGNVNINSASTGMLSTVGTRRLNWDADQLYPQIDNDYNLGHASYRYDDIYATNGTIQTSDFNEKQDIAELSDAEQRVAVACKGLLRKFRWKDSVAEKGDEARTHFGIIAQDLQAAFAAEGLDAGDYAMFISTTWTDEETNEEKTRMGVRYSELLAFIIAAI